MSRFNRREPDGLGGPRADKSLGNALVSGVRPPPRSIIPDLTDRPGADRSSIAFFEFFASKASDSGASEQRRDMPRGYVIMTEVIRDSAGMAAHGVVTYGSLVEHGAKMLVVDADYEVREGTWEQGSRLAIMEFESPEVARHWYESESGQEAHKLRTAAADCNVLIASGFVPKNPGNRLAVSPSSRVDGLERLPESPKWQSGRPTAGSNLPGEALGVAPGRGRMVGRRVVIVGGGQTNFQLERSAHRQRSSAGDPSCPRGGSCRRGGSGRDFCQRHGRTDPGGRRRCRQSGGRCPRP